jgi:hypothetical protein
LFTISSGSGTKAVWATTRSFTVNRNFELAVDQYNEGQFTITPSTAIGGSTYTTPVMAINASSGTNPGFVGIGTTAPAYKLVVSNGKQIALHADADNCYAYANAPMFIATTVASPVIFQTNSTERMRIDTSGNLLVGTTSADGRVSILAANNTSPALTTRGVSGDVATASTWVIKFDNNSTGSQIFTQFFINNGNAGSGLIAANGASQAAFAAYSDARLKENIADLPAQLDNILALRPVEFDYIESEGGGHQIGFIAQEIEQVFPDAVGEREDGMKTVTGWTKTEAILVKAIQELTARVAQLEGN